MAKKTVSKRTKSETKEVKTKKSEKIEKGEKYYCEVCGCEIVCINPSEASVVCCEEPMVLQAVRQLSAIDPIRFLNYY